MSYVPLRGDFTDESNSVIVQFYSVPYADNYNYSYDNIMCYNSKVALYSPMQTRLGESYDMHPFKTQILAEYNALRIGLTNAIKMDITNIVLNTDSQRLLDHIIEAYIDDSESESSTLSILSLDAEDLHDEVIDLLDEFDIVAYRYLSRHTMLQFEDHVNSYMRMNNSFKSMGVSKQFVPQTIDMDIDM
jgi:ribonuclease HI